MPKTKPTGSRGGLPAGSASLAAALLLAASFGVALARGDRDGAAPLTVGRSAPGGAAGGEPAPPPSSGGVVDSVFPIEEEIRRFRVGLPEATELSGGAPTRDQLVERFVRAIESADSAALVPLLLDRSEFGWLYYPHTMYTAPPYELSPALLWFQMQNLTDSGISRLFRRASGGPLHVAGYRCEDTPAKQGANTVWSACTVTLHPPGGESVDMQLFGSILERGGTYKFVSFANDL
jgi:hypothetical protein